MKDEHLNTKLLNEIANVSSRLKKEKLLLSCDGTDKSLLIFACDPMITFGVTADVDEQLLRWNKFTYRTTSKVFWSAFLDLCEFLSTRKLTGNAALNQIDDLLVAAPDEQDVIWACRVLNKDLCAGISVATINKVFPKLIDDFCVALATPYDPDKHELNGCWIVEPKLDGLRMVIIDGLPFTRNGRKITSADNILIELRAQTKFKLNEFVIDGEIMGVGSFDEASGVIRRKDQSSDALVYNVFDMIPFDEWAAKYTRNTRDRKKLITSLLEETTHVKIVPFTDVPKNPSVQELLTIRDNFIDNGFEGAMLKDLNAAYMFKRSKFLLKLKRMIDADVFIRSTFEGKKKYKGKLGGFIVYSDEIAPTRVGSGFDDEQRMTFWKKRDDLISRCIEVQYQELTKDKVMRFPVFIKMRPDRD